MNIAFNIFTVNITRSNASKFVGDYIESFYLSTLQGKRSRHVLHQKLLDVNCVTANFSTAKTYK